MRKKAWLLVALLAFLGFNAPVVTAQATFDAKQFGLMTAQGKSSAKVHFGASREEVGKVFGQPTKKARLADEIEGGFIDVVFYRTNKLYFKRNRLEGFELHDSSLAYGKSPASAFRIGSKVASVPKTYPKGASVGANYLLNGTPLADFEVDTKPGKSRNVNYSLIALSYPKFGATLADDGALELLFDANHRLIMLAMGE